MALVKCKECGKEMSDKADACPHCGIKQPKAPGFASFLRIVFMVAVVILMLPLMVMCMSSRTSQPLTASESSANTTLSRAAGACTVANIEIKSMRAGFSNKCRTRTCMAFEGVAVLKNNCREAVGAQIKITAYAKDGSPLATRELWPASVRNIPPGDFEFSLDTWLDYQPGMHKFALSVVDVKRW